MLPIHSQPYHHPFHCSFCIRTCVRKYLGGNCWALGKMGRRWNKRGGERICWSSSSPIKYIISTLSCPSVCLSVWCTELEILVHFLPPLLGPPPVAAVVASEWLKTSALTGLHPDLLLPFLPSSAPLTPKFYQLKKRFWAQIEQRSLPGHGGERSLDP